MMNPAVFAILATPVAVFASAGIVEFRRDRQSLRSPKRLLPLVAALVVAMFMPVEILAGTHGLDVPPDVVNRISTIMSPVSLLVGLCAFFCGYKSRLTTGLIFFGSLVLAYLWLINRFVA